MVSPLTAQPITSSEFIPNLAIKQQLDDFARKQRECDRMKFFRAFSSLDPAQKTSAAVRLLLMGDCGVGKTSIKNHLEFDRLDPSYIQPTIGIESVFVQCEQKGLLTDDEKVVVRITDICGQDKFRSVSRQCYRGIHGVVMVCSVDNVDSVKNLRRKWSDDLFEFAPDNVYGVVVVNKCDLLHSVRDEGELQKYELVMRSAIQFSHFMGYPVYCTSAVTGEYIHSAFAEITKRIVQDSMLWDMISNPPKWRASPKVSIPLEAMQMNSNGCSWALIGVGEYANRAFQSIKKSLN